MELAGDEAASPSTRVIIHLDLDCFYAQVEQRRLKIPDGQPVAVQQWGSLLAVNYDARKFGVERGDFVDDAKKKCPHIHLPHVDTLGENRKPGHLFDRTHQKAILRRYRVASREIFAILGSMVPVIEKASIDEAFMDVTELAKQRLAQTTVFSSDFCQDPANHDTKVFGIASKDDSTSDSVAAFPLTEVERLLCIGAMISREIRQAIYSKLGYTCSTGVSGNKLLAKLASPLNKPSGQVVVAPRFVADLMKSLPMRKVRGLGGKLGKQLESIYERLGVPDQGASAAGESPEDAFKKLTAHTFLERCGLADLSKHVGQETAAYVHQICQGNDGNEPVEEKKVQVKMLGCVKQFDQRSGAALVRVEQLEYWVRLLCEEMVMRCEDERIENKRFPSQLAIQFTRAKPGDKPRTCKLGIAQDTTVDELYAAAMNVMRLHLDSVFPLAVLSMHAKNFHELDSQAVTTISSFFTRGAGQAASAAQRMEKEMKQFAAKRGRDGSASPLRKSSRQKISAFFSQPGSIVDGVNTVGPATAATSTCADQSETADGHFCAECQRIVPEPRAEHADFHFALKLSQAQRGEAMAIAGAARPKKKKGPLDAFLAR
ncbi:DNA polymerase iota/DNA damage inducible protein [Phytophthora cinnamomi]|uniref:DNA polymerase iota/DNA damage inducible protein n=1 Tax=Phytophthora cinnamomi TaxID=4785 RepID=UPI003559B106|nr:DNA polymerase iota/DNA damage inducible protein [Phytophthora cinnamomi]